MNAQWISGGGAFRSTIEVKDGLLRARAYVTGIGYYEFHCNGNKLSEAALAPSCTDFSKRIEYETIDLTPVLKEGANCLGFLVANGWWRHGPYDLEKNTNQVLAEIVLDYADGRQELFITDEHWQTDNGPLIAEENTSPHQLYDGVSLDLRWLGSGWCTAIYDAAEWETATVSEDKLGKLVPTLLPPVKEVETLQPLSIKQLSTTLLSIDFGQNHTGWIRFRSSGKAGTRLTVRHAELIHGDGQLNTGTLRTAQQRDSFILSGNVDEWIEPRFCYHGFRYAEIEGDIDAIDLDSIQGAVVHTDLNPISTISSSDERINWLLRALKWTVKGNSMSMLTDVCQRDERFGWLMDGVSALRAGTLFFDMGTLARKWLDDMVVSQEEDGSLYSDTAPSWFPCKSIGWQRAIVLLPMAIYETFGDIDFLKKSFPAMQKYADYLANNLEDDLIPDGFSRHPVEWLDIAKANAQLGDNAFTVDVFDKMAEAADALAEESKHYTDLAARVRVAAHKKWHHASGKFGYDNAQSIAQSNLIYGLRFGLVDKDDRDCVFDALLCDLMDMRGDGPYATTGIGSTEHLPIVLSENGRDDLVWEWLQRDEYPSYGFMQKQGATALWERWEHIVDDGMNAHNHTGLSGIGIWLMQYLIGIRVSPGPEPVFYLQPAVHLPLAEMDAKWQSSRGELCINWKTENDKKHLTIVIPPGCRALLTLPDKTERDLRSGTHYIKELS
jgi:alpha-L-rhamnosidase